MILRPAQHLSIDVAVRWPNETISVSLVRVAVNPSSGTVDLTIRAGMGRAEETVTLLFDDLVEIVP